MFDAAIARLWLMDDDGDTLSVRVSAGLEVGGGVDRLRVGEGFVGRVAATRAPLTIADLASDPRPLNTERLRARGLAAFAGVPLLVGERVKLGQGLSGRAFAAGHALVLDVEAADIAPDELANVRRLGYTTFLGVPLKIGGRAIGVLTFRARRPFSARDQELAEAFAGQSAIAIEHARLVREASEQADRMRALADLSRVFAGTLD